MSSNADIVKHLRTTADASATYRNKWLSDDNWIDLIKAHDTNSNLTSLKLNAAIRRDYSTKHAVDLKDGASTRTGIYRNTKQVSNNRKVCYYYLTEVGSDVDEQVWSNAAGVRTQEVCRSVPLLGKNTTATDEKKAHHDNTPSEIRARKR